MKIIYSKYTFEEVHNTRRKWLSDEPGTSHEKIKYDKTIDIEKLLERQKMLKEFISDHNAVFTLTGNVLKVTICEDGYCEEKSFQLSETEAEDIRENGTFDFSYLDEEWKKIKIKE